MRESGLMPLDVDLRSLGLRSDLATLQGISEITTHSDRVVVRTPSEPTYWHGNAVIFRTTQVAPEPQIAQFRADFPEAEHVTLAWDAPGMALQPGHRALQDLGFDLDQSDILVHDGRFRDPDVPDGLALRPITSDDDWAQVTALQYDTGIEQGYEAGPHKPYITRRMAAQRRIVEGGRGCWFGAFEDRHLVGDLGLILGPDLARFQSVETRKSHRKRGISSALICTALAWRAARAPDVPVVMVADQDGAPGRLYRSLGFELRETLLSACAGSYART